MLDLPVVNTNLFVAIRVPCAMPAVVSVAVFERHRLEGRNDAGVLAVTQFVVRRCVPPRRTPSVRYGTVELDILSSSPISIKKRHKKVRLKM